MKFTIFLRKVIRRIRSNLTQQVTSEEFNEILKKRDIIVGEKTVFYGPDSIVIDIQRPWLVKIGAFSKITQGTVILAHDYSRSVLRKKYDDILCEASKTIIGDNVFIGMNSIILMGTKIGNNVIVGAGSVVSGVIPDDVVIAGNPARIIRSLDEHYRIRKTKQIEEAKLCAREYFNRYNKYPSIKDMGAFFPLYLERDINTVLENGLSFDWGGDSSNDVIESFLNSEPVYDSFDSFLVDTFNNQEGDMDGKTNT